MTVNTHEEALGIADGHFGHITTGCYNGERLLEMLTQMVVHQIGPELTSLSKHDLSVLNWHLDNVATLARAATFEFERIREATEFGVPRVTEPELPRSVPTSSQRAPQPELIQA
jgi:hypothetical protein